MRKDGKARPCKRANCVSLANPHTPSAAGNGRTNNSQRATDSLDDAISSAEDNVGEDQDKEDLALPKEDSPRPGRVCASDCLQEVRQAVQESKPSEDDDRELARHNTHVNHRVRPEYDQRQ